MAMSRKPFAWGAVGALLVLLLIWSGIPRVLIEQHTFRSHHDKLRGVFEELRERCPPRVNAKAWDEAINWIIIASANICTSPDRVSNAEMAALRADIDERLEGPVDLETLFWIWDRLGRTGPEGKLYVDRFGEYFLSCVNAASESA